MGTGLCFSEFWNCLFDGCAKLLIVVAVNSLNSQKLISKRLRDPEEAHKLGESVWVNPVGHIDKQVYEYKNPLKHEPHGEPEQSDLAAKLIVNKFYL